MNLLICTQKVNKEDGNLGFFHAWIEQFAKNCEEVTVICLEEGRHTLPNNVRVFSLGKDKGVSKLGYILNFYRYIIRERHAYDAVFVHMNDEYLVLGGLLWKLWGKRTSLWYTHHSVTWHLRLGVHFADMIFTAARESFRLPTKKPVHVFGHGIDVEHFPAKKKTEPHQRLTLLVDARISRSKQLERLLDMSQLLSASGCAHKIRIVGAAITSDDIAYEKELRRAIKNGNISVEIVGPMPYPEIPAYYESADIMINLANVGGLNKSVLQAMAMNLYVLTSNEAYRGILPSEQIVANIPEGFCEAILFYVKVSKPLQYREIILRDHSLNSLVRRLCAVLDLPSRLSK